MNKIKKIREDKGWTQQDLSMRTGIPQSIISALENERIPLYPKYEKVISEALEVAPEKIARRE